jgi:hypothetical protein
MIYFKKTMTTKKIPIPKTPLTRATKDAEDLQKSLIKKRTISSNSKTTILPIPPSRVHALQKQKTNITKRVFSNIIKIFIVIIIWFIIWLFKDSIISYINISTPKEQFIVNKWDDVLFIGKDISTTGIIQKIDSKRLNYIYTIENSTYGTLWLRSSIVNFNTLSGSVKLQGKVVDFINNIYVVDVTNAEIISQHQASNTQKLLYFSRPWLLIQNMTTEWFTITNQESNNISSLVINNPSTKAQVTIRYFSCSTDQAYDCQRFQKTFESTVGISFSDSYKNNFYKLKDANTRFVNLDNRYGIYIETSSESLLTMIVKNIQFITNERAKKTLTPLAKTLCVWSGYVLNEVTEWNVSYNSNNTLWNIQWVSQDYDPITCTMLINPLDLSLSTLVYLGKKPWIVIGKDSLGKLEQEIVPNTIEEKPTANTIVLSNTNNVTQIPLKPGKELLFSTKGLTISFPSPNIAFESININKTVQWLSCSSSTNITSYSNKANLKTTPSVIMYFCKNWTAIDNTSLRVFTLANATILIEILDPAWADFINWIKIN